MAKTKSKKDFKKILKLRKYLLPVVLSIILTFLLITTYQVFISDKYYPLTFVGDTNISFLSKGQAIREIEARFTDRANQKITLNFPQGNFTIDLATSSANLDYSSLDSAFSSPRAGSFWNNLKNQFISLVLTNQISPKISLNLDKQIDTIALSVDKPYQNAQVIFDETTTPEGSSSANIQTKDGVDGFSLDKEELKKTIANFLLTGKYKKDLPIKTVTPKVTTSYALKVKAVLDDSLKNPVKLTFQDKSWIIDTKSLLTLLDLTEGKTLLDKDQTDLYLGKIAGEINQDVQEGLFEFDPTTKRVSNFKPSQEGRKLNQDQTYQQLLSLLNTDGPKTLNLPVEVVKPKIETSDVNSLGIKELIGRGISNFEHSIPNRIYNVNLTAQKINGVLVPPGEIFSFNQTVGDISAATGFKQAYVIKEGRTVLDDGGGVCQDSTTLFRAVLNAGLPVVKRTAHAYRVGYYEQGFPPGLDATVFYPSVDFQFKNDTDHHILIQAYTDGLTLYVDLYGTSDGRVTTVSKPVVTDQTPPPPDLRQDDPTLPKGTVKQVDFSAWGANVYFKRTVTRNGETLADETWRSSYKPWQAIFLVGTKE